MFLGVHQVAGNEESHRTVATRNLAGIDSLGQKVQPGGLGTRLETVWALGIKISDNARHVLVICSMLWSFQWDGTSLNAHLITRIITG